MLFASGHTERAADGEAIALTANFLAKPYSQAELAQQIRRTLDEPQQDNFDPVI
ncbi:MAG: hypothetical protein L3J28_06660 [Candidatus Polarisedimenticolaceae bacterium]|nr:hypothetical protein [Candidatus Polarisedimenticolaceae bacterium]